VDTKRSPKEIAVACLRVAERTTDLAAKAMMLDMFRAWMAIERQTLFDNERN
jgi:hypothetical protein